MRAEFTEQPVAHSSRPLPPRTEPCCQPLSLTAMANSSDPSGPAWPPAQPYRWHRPDPGLAELYPSHSHIEVTFPPLTVSGCRSLLLQGMRRLCLLQSRFFLTEELYDYEPVEPLGLWGSQRSCRRRGGQSRPGELTSPKARCSRRRLRPAAQTTSQVHSRGTSART